MFVIYLDFFYFSKKGMHGSLYIIQNVNIFSNIYFYFSECIIQNVSCLFDFFFILLHEHFISRKHEGGVIYLPTCC